MQNIFTWYLKFHAGRQRIFTQVPGDVIVGPLAWNFKYQVKLFCIVFFQQNSGGEGAASLSKMLANFVSWLKKSFSWNRLTLILVGNKGFVLKLESWYVSTKTDLISKSIPFSTRTLILLMSADHASRVRILDCFKLAINWKMTMTSLYVVKIFDVAVFFLSSLVTGVSFTSVPLLVITGSGIMAVFFIRDCWEIRKWKM